jgi:putative ABC transport system ATP-binding protein
VTTRRPSPAARGWPAGLTVLIATHDSQIAARCDRLIRLADGAITDDLDLTGGESPGETIRRAGQLG